MPVTQVKLPDGRQVGVSHPEGATDEQILSFAKRQYDSGSYTQEAPPSDYESTAGDYGRSLFQGLSFGFGDEIEARIAAKQKGTSYEEELARIRGEMKQFEQDSPIAAMGTEFVGSFLLPGGMATKAATKLGALGKAALYGTGTGGLYGAGKSEEKIGSSKFTDDVLMSAGTGGVASTGLQTLGQLAVGTGRMVKGFAKKADTVNQVDKLKNLKNSAYDQLDKATVIADPKKVIPQLANNISNALRRQGYKPAVHQDAAEIFQKRIQSLVDSGEAFTVKNLDSLRSRIYKDANKLGGDDAIYVTEMGREVDDLIDYMLRKSPNVADDAARAAREINTKYMKVKTLDEAFKNVSGGGGSLYSKYRAAVEKILRNKAQMRFFDEAEIEAMKAFTNPSLGRRIVDQVGRFAPGSNTLAGLLQLTHVALNPKMAGLSAIASGASLGSNVATQRAAQELIDVLAKQQAPKSGARLLPQAPIGLASEQVATDDPNGLFKALLN